MTVPSAPSPPAPRAAPENSGAASRGRANGHLSRCASTASASQAGQLALPSPAAKRLAPGARPQGAPREAEEASRGERRRPMAFGARLGGVDRLLQRLVVRDPQGGGGGV